MRPVDCFSAARPNDYSPHFKRKSLRGVSALVRFGGKCIGGWCGTPFLLSLLSVHPVIPFQFLPPCGTVVCFLLWSSWLKQRHSPFGRRSNNIFRLLNLFCRPSDLENRRRPDSFPVGQALRVLLVCLYLIHILVYYIIITMC
jgi:hypothetical protein